MPTSGRARPAQLRFRAVQGVRSQKRKQSGNRSELAPAAATVDEDQERRWSKRSAAAYQEGFVPGRSAARMALARNSAETGRKSATRQLLSGIGQTAEEAESDLVELAYAIAAGFSNGN